MNFVSFVEESVAIENEQIHKITIRIYVKIYLKEKIIKYLPYPYRQERHIY